MLFSPLVAHWGKVGNLEEDRSAGQRWAAPYNISTADLDPGEPFNGLSFKPAQAD